MSLFLIAIVALSVSTLTLFSGFGLGTLLMPVFALFFPVDIAVAATAVVHALNNVFKVTLLGRTADFKIVLRFGLPAIVAAFFGANLLNRLSDLPAFFESALFGFQIQMTPIPFLLGLLILGFAILELAPHFQRLSIDPKYLSLGGALSGFFGGLSGHQGALRSAFLAKTKITTEAFVGTNAVIGFLVDLARLSVYSTILFRSQILVWPLSREGQLVFMGALAAFVGVFFGKKILHKVTMRSVQLLTGALLFLIGGLLVLGMV